MSFSDAINAVTGSNPAQLPFVIGRRNTGAGLVIIYNSIFDWFPIPRKRLDNSHIPNPPALSPTNQTNSYLNIEPIRIL